MGRSVVVYGGGYGWEGWGSMGRAGVGWGGMGLDGVR